jgi:hypothetical protein
VQVTTARDRQTERRPLDNHVTLKSKENIMDTLFTIYVVLTSVIAIASAVVAATPSMKDDVVLGKIMVYVAPVIKILSLKIGNAK